MPQHAQNPFAEGQLVQTYMHGIARRGMVGPITCLCWFVVLMQVCLMTNPIWLIKTRLQLQTGKATAAVGDAAAAAASAPPSTSATLKSAPSSRQASTPSPPHTHSQSAPAPRPGHPGHAAGTFPATHTTHVSHAPSTAAATGAQSSPSPSATAAARQGVPAGAGPGSCVSGSRQYKGLVDAIVRIGREEGLRGYYKGLGPSLVLVSVSLWGLPTHTAQAQPLHRC